jgi:phosphatidylglycerol:prolipoprotein diacylglycerol transferase
LLHTITEFAGLFIGFRYYLFLKRRKGDVIESSNRLWIIISVTLGAFIGSRLIGALENPPAFMQSKNVFAYFYSNKTIVGGLLGGLAGVELVKKMIKEKNASGDLFTYPLILALVIGRIGCFSMGIYEETYGLATTLPWGMHLGDDQLRHPVCLYEILFLILLWITLAQIEKRYLLLNGVRFKIFMIVYCAFRFMLDFIKPHYTFSIGLSTIQIATLLGLLHYYRYIIHPKKLIHSQNMILT